MTGGVISSARRRDILNGTVEDRQGVYSYEQKQVLHGVDYRRVKARPPMGDIN